MQDSLVAGTSLTKCEYLYLKKLTQKLADDGNFYNQTAMSYSMYHVSDYFVS